MTRLLSLIEYIANLRGISILLVLYAAVFGMILFTLGQLSDVTGGYGILDFDHGYSFERVQEVLGSYGAKGMALNARIQILDLFNPALYSMIAATLTYLLWKGHGPKWLALLPVLGGLGDYMENVTLFLMARSYPDISEGLVSLSSTLSLVKNVLLPIAILPFLVGLIYWLFRVARARASGNAS